MLFTSSFILDGHSIMYKEIQTQDQMCATVLQLIVEQLMALTIKT